MTAFVALLRGINVGKAKRIPMADLRDLLAELGYTGVATLLNSGNAVFQASTGTAAKHASEISAAIATRFQFDVPVIVKSAKELAAIAAENPFAENAADHSRLLIAFVQDAKSLAGLKPLVQLAVAPEEFVIGKKAAYLHCVSGILESKVGAGLLGKAGKATTTRNWATVLKLLTLAGESAPGRDRIPVESDAMQTPDGIKIIPTVYQEVLALLKSDVLAAVEYPIAAKRRLKMIYDHETASMTYLRAQISVSGLTTAEIEEYLSRNKDALIRFGLRFLGDPDATSDEQEYAEGEEQDPPGESEIRGLSNGMGIKIAIYHNFLTNRTLTEFLAFLKNRRMPKAANFARDLARVYFESQK